MRVTLVQGREKLIILIQSLVVEDEDNLVGKGVTMILNVLLTPDQFLF